MLRIPQACLDDLYAHAQGTPDEVCGLIAGRRHADGTHEVTRVYRIRNAHARPRGEFLLDAQEQLRAVLEIEDEHGEEVVAFYHSHPGGPPRFSQTDAARASWPGVSYFLVYLKPRLGHLSARFDRETRRFRPEEVEIVAAAKAT